MRKVIFVFDGRAYQWNGFYGCQLASMEWRTLPAGTTRKLDFEDGCDAITITIFSTRRQGLRVFTTWAISSSGTHAEHRQRIVELRERLWGRRW